MASAMPAGSNENLQLSQRNEEPEPAPKLPIPYSQQRDSTDY